MTVGKCHIVNPNEGIPLPETHKVTVWVTSSYGKKKRVREVKQIAVGPRPGAKKNLFNSGAAGLLPIPTTHGVVINEKANVSAVHNKLPPTVLGKGKGKMLISSTVCSDGSSSDEDELLMPLVHSPHDSGLSKIVGATGIAPPISASSPVQVFCTSDLMEGTNYLPLLAANNSAGQNECFGQDDDATFCLEDQDDNDLEQGYFQ
ncbi:hypothetical protein BVRB_2g032250 [Beta vulgaris subsp. vulgaris]|nr:hypothetical protein BVRB_2g032250 [Beta vulgaris subsp. vulgaris]